MMGVVGVTPLVSVHTKVKGSHHEPWLVCDGQALNIGVPEVERPVNDVANLYIVSDTYVSRNVSESNAANKSDKVLLPVVPHPLVILPHSEFCRVVRAQQECLMSAGWSLPAINEMEQDH